MQTPHKKAYEYTYTFIDPHGVTVVDRKYIAICEGIDIHSLINGWKKRCSSFQHIDFIGEVDLKTALYTRSITGASIANDWQLLSHMLFHSVTVERTEKF